jgi:hypothetical protein
VRRAAVLALVVLAVGTPSAAAAPTGSIDLLAAFRTQVAKVKRATTVPVLLPRSLLVAGPAPRVYASGGPARGGWVLLLSGAPRCGGANACFIASFEAQRGKRLPGRANVSLAGGTRALYIPIGCGASCSPASLFFVRGGVLYSWQVKNPPAGASAARAALIRMANDALRAGPR